MPIRQEKLMESELAYVLINPYMIRKSRTGGIIARILARTDLNFVAARMYGPSKALAKEYAELIRDSATDVNPIVAEELYKYIMHEYAPSERSGNPHRIMLLLFQGENAIQKIWDVVGAITAQAVIGLSIRDTYGDFIKDSEGDIRYFEPAVIIGHDKEDTYKALRLWAKHEDQGGIIDFHGSFGKPDVERTLVMLKPDNFKEPSLRAGNILDILSAAGLRLICVNKFTMTLEQANAFYGQVQDALYNKFNMICGVKLNSAISEALGLDVKLSEEDIEGIRPTLGPLYAKKQFDSIIEFMTGLNPSKLSKDGNNITHSKGCLALVYQGKDAISKIREVLGPTDPTKAKPGSVRREFGSNIMVNAAHASDSPENAAREMEIIGVEKDYIKPWVDKYC
jgi:nucleoside diphosphate kinase